MQMSHQWDTENWLRKIKKREDIISVPGSEKSESKCSLFPKEKTAQNNTFNRQRRGFAENSTWDSDVIYMVRMVSRMFQRRGIG